MTNDSGSILDKEAHFRGIYDLYNTGAIKKYDGLKHSGDEADAWKLAHLLPQGILPTGIL